jgi:hypothetical protein
MIMHNLGGSSWHNVAHIALFRHTVNRIDSADKSVKREAIHMSCE